MNILGVILTWNNLEFFKCALNQSLSFCDEVIVVDGCHIDGYEKHSTDGTIEFINSMRNHPNLVIIDDFNFTGRNDIVQCKIRSEYAKQSKYWKPGNWIIQWDDDIAFFNKDLKRIKDIMNTTDCDTLFFRESRFAFNFKCNILADINELYGVKFQKIKDGCYYTPTWKLHNADGSIYNKWLKLSDIMYFHYPYVKTTHRVKFRWEISKEKYEGDFEDLGLLWDNFDLIQFNENIFRKIIGGKGKINLYQGHHPEIMNSHPWRYVEDMRKIIL